MQWNPVHYTSSANLNFVCEGLNACSLFSQANEQRCESTVGFLYLYEHYIDGSFISMAFLVMTHVVWHLEIKF
jgi:hypothetical protein